MFEVFNKTVRGASHVTSDTPCQDYSGIYVDELVPWYSAVVADGHGDPTCPRSQRGSQLAVHAAIDVFHEFVSGIEAKGGLGEVVIGIAFSDAASSEAVARTLSDDLEGNTTGGETMRSLGNSIVSKWYDSVMLDLQSDPLSDEELNRMGIDRTFASNNRAALRHAYGTTLICCMVYNGRVFLLQQGDGRCDVFFADGHVEQPIPWDKDCHDEYTTSLCGDDAAQRIRTWVIDLNKDSIAAVFMGSDGIEDSFPNMEGTHCFYRQLAQTVEKYGTGEEFEEVLTTYLDTLSENGSADDMSVAGIVDLELVRELSPRFEKEISAYNKELELRETELKLQSKLRKYESAIKQTHKLDLAKQKMENEHSKLSGVVEDYQTLQRKREALEREINELRGTEYVAASTNDSTVPSSNYATQTGVAQRTESPRPAKRVTSKGGSHKRAQQSHGTHKTPLRSRKKYSGGNGLVIGIDRQMRFEDFYSSATRKEG